MSKNIIIDPFKILWIFDQEVNLQNAYVKVCKFFSTSEVWIIQQLNYHKLLYLLSRKLRCLMIK